MKGACDDRQGWLARMADPAESGALTAAERASLEAHLDRCAECRAALADQRFVASALRGRGRRSSPLPRLPAQLAARLDETSSWLGLLDWRVWTLRLAPVALAIFLAAVFSGSPSTSTATTSGTEITPATLDTWTHGVDESSSVASAVWQDRTSSDALIETMLLGSSMAREDANVR